MAHTAAQDSNIPTAGPLFENTCGRRSTPTSSSMLGPTPSNLSPPTATPRRTATRSSNATAQHTATAPPLHGRKKNGARTVAQRRTVLEADPWTTTVAPHHVVCRGCKRTIRLDGRSLYYPGLWEKHRERCEKVKEGRAEPQMEELSAAKPVGRSCAKAHASPVSSPPDMHQRTNADEGSSRLLRVTA
ncbi:hypothetical protein B0H13DRAFT_2367086 [Mycena leptocephala]|nr:hypothetical protein B0H13DRAFT_2367086 [Mycena leptocephala]